MKGLNFINLHNSCTPHLGTADDSQVDDGPCRQLFKKIVASLILLFTTTSMANGGETALNNQQLEFSQLQNLRTTQVVMLNPEAAPIEWKPHFRNVVDEFSALLPTSFHPRQIRLIYSPAGTYNYNLFQGTLTLSNISPTIMTHELSHVYLDRYLRKKSKAWSYLRGIHATGAKTLDSAIQTHTHNLDNLTNAANEFKDQKVLYKRTQNSIQQVEALIKLLKFAKQGEERFAKNFNNKKNFKTILPYHELFADALTSILTNDWESMAQPTLEMIQREPNRMPLPEGLSLENYLKQRGFEKEWTLTQYKFEPSLAKSNHTQYPVFRSHFRKTTDSGVYSRSELMTALAEAIIVDYEDAVSKGDFHRSLYEKNRSLIENFNKQLW